MKEESKYIKYLKSLTKRQRLIILWWNLIQVDKFIHFLKCYDAGLIPDVSFNKAKKLEDIEIKSTINNLICYNGGFLKATRYHDCLNEDCKTCECNQ